MSASAIPTSAQQIQSLASLFQLNQTNNLAASKDADGDHDGSSGSSRVGGGKLAQSVMEVLASMGATGSTNSSNPSNSVDPTQAIQSFLQTLMSALQSQIGSASSSASSDANSNQTDSTALNALAPSNGHHHHHGGGKLDAALQTLINDLSGSSSGSSGTGATTDALTALQQSANNLFSATGVTGGNTSITSLLKGIEQVFASGSTTGNFVNTVA